jgi:hypothetical protein
LYTLLGQDDQYGIPLVGYIAFFGVLLLYLATIHA